MTRDSLALRLAIRRFTVEQPDDAPNGKAEAAMVLLSRLLDPSVWPNLSHAQRAILDQANGAAAALCEALADDTQALREAAEDYLGGDFGKPFPAIAGAERAAQAVERRAAGVGLGRILDADQGRPGR